MRLSMFYSTLLLTGVNLLLRLVATSFQVYISGRIGATGVGLLQLVLSVAMLAETAAVLVWNFWWLSRVERPGLQITGCAAGLAVFSWCHRILVPLAGTALYVGVLLLAGRNVRKGIFGKSSSAWDPGGPLTFGQPKKFSLYFI